MILLIDNYDSFTYNIYQLMGELIPDIIVYRNDQISIDGILALKPDRIILSPGPGYPSAAGLMPSIIRRFSDLVPILGICLGHQALAEAFGGRIIEAAEPVHGKRSAVRLDTRCPLFHGLPNDIIVGRYHSLVVERESLPQCLIIAAVSPDNQIMAIQHNALPLFGLQFHPESILTEHGQAMLAAFLRV